MAERLLDSGARVVVPRRDLEPGSRFRTDGIEGRCTIALADLLYVSDLIQSRTFRTFEVFTAVIVFYLSLTLPLELLVSRLERRLAVLR